MLTEDLASVYFQYKEENGQKQREESESLKPKIDALRRNFEMACAAFDSIVDYDNDEGSAKRRLDVVMERLLNIKSMLNERSDPVDFRYRSYQNRLSEYEVTFGSLMNTLTIQIDDFKNEVLESIEDGLSNATEVAKENQELKVLLKREKEEVMHQQQSHNFAVTEKNTILATCRKLEEQLEEKNKQILQLQKEGTVTLWKREKTKLLDGIKTKEVDLSKELEKTQVEASGTKERLQRRIVELTGQIKLLKLEKELGGKLGTGLDHENGSSTPDVDNNSLKQQLYRKERALVMAEAELQKQQKYFIGFIHGLQRDLIIMLEREGKKTENYSRDNKAYMNMLKRIYTAAKEGELSDLKAKLPVHYQGVHEDSLKHPLGKRLTKSMSELNREYYELQQSGAIYDPTLMKPSLKKWRDAKSANERPNHSQTYGVHPILVDIATGTLLTSQAINFFPEWTEDDIKEMFEQFRKFDANNDFHLDPDELLKAIPDILGRMTTTEEIQEAMDEIDNDNSGTIDFFEFLTVARLVTQQKGKSAIFKKKRLTALQKSSQARSKICVIQ
ncbi:uncharacterized protein LOC114527495 [Dendronephthya gigantea]|uniref:uncharacterized protein LOC114527495 n=1 Tax=Dendronephthya gigantea TaxID=151771 RepID=UPI00106DA729|nr:uncharacterized protein LOC114527495 [Dendronephthya gigantea]